MNHSHDTDGPPCRHMETFLQGTADGSANPLSRWYATAHTARCGRCRQFLERMTETRARLKEVKEPLPDDVMARLMAKIPVDAG